MSRKRYILFAGLVLLVAGGCSLLQKENDGQMAEPANSQKPVSSSEKVSEKIEDSVDLSIPETDIVAKVGGYAITKQDVEDSISLLEQQLGQKIDRDKVTKEQKKMIADMLINNRLLYLAAKNEGLDSDPDVKKAIEKAKEQILAQALLNRYNDTINPTEMDLETFYNTGKYKGNDVKLYFTEPEKRRIQEIAVESESEAKQILVDIMQGNITFRSAAKKYSVLDSASKGGDLGYKSVQELLKINKPEKYINTAWTLDKGELSSVFKVGDKYYIIKVAGVRPQREKAFSDVKDQVEFLYKTSKLEKLQNEAIETVKKSGVKIEEHYENL